MTFETQRFGPVEVNEEQIVTFTDGIPGLERYRRFFILHDERIAPLVWLHSLEDGAIALPVINVFDVMEDYVLDISDDDVERLSIDQPEDVLVLIVAVIPEDVEKMSGNLAAPIVLNAKNGQARQLLTNVAEYSVQQPIFAAIAENIKRREEKNAGAVTQGE